MEIVISETKHILGKKAARMGGELIRTAILDRGNANISKNDLWILFHPWSSIMLMATLTLMKNVSDWES
jgi:hypothetical protein